MGLPYNVHPVNIGKNEQFHPDFLRISPQHTASPPSPTRKVRAASRSACSNRVRFLIYLAEKTGKFLPSDARKQSTGDGMADVADGRLRPHARTGPPFPRRREQGRSALRPGALFQGDAPPLRRPGQAAWRASDHVAGDISIADFAILGWAWRHERHMVDLADFPNVKAWVRTLHGPARNQEGVRGGAVVAEAPRQGWAGPRTDRPFPYRRSISMVILTFTPRITTISSRRIRCTTICHLLTIGRRDHPAGLFV